MPRSVNEQDHITNADYEVSPGLDDDTIVIDLDRTISMPQKSPPCASGSRIGMDTEGPRRVSAEEIDGPSDGSGWFQSQPSATMMPEQQWAGSPTKSSSPEALPLYAESTSTDSGLQGNEVAGAAVFAAMATFLQELTRLSLSLVDQLPISHQRWRDAIPAVCAVMIGLVCRCASVRHANEAADASDFSTPPEADLGV